MSAPLLELRGLSGGYEPIRIFEGVDLVVEPGASIGFFGPNGHGKTTLMKTVSGVLEPWTGDVIFAGERLNRAAPRRGRRWRNFNYDLVTRRRMDPKRVARAGLIHVPQGNLLFPEMTVEEVLDIAPLAAAGRVPTRAAARALREQAEALFPRIAERRLSKIRFLSGGERQMVSIAAGLMAAPKLLILDEPTLGLSPKLRRELADAVRAIHASGVPLILIDQDVGFLSSLIDRLYLFDHGRISRRLERGDIPDHGALMAMLFGEAA
ncbi:MAG: ABC transporter ATP-binding protein [Pikeienuella sp.]|uniref:ABC transporter ATP-binding protein n=1 Tax=Pikeienuella sp. TaxID=2831957 RepID=UPI00391BA21E